MDDDAFELFARQHSAAAYWQLVHDERSRGRVEGWVRSGRVDAPMHGVLTLRGARWTPEQEVMVAVLRAGPGARAVGPRVLALLGIRGFTRDGPFGVLVPKGRTVTGADASGIFFRDPVPGDTTASVDGIPVPGSARCMVEVSRWRSGAGLRSAVDAGAWERRPALDVLEAKAFSLPRPYIPAARIRALFRSGVLQVESEGERRLWQALGPIAARFEKQVWVAPRIRVDGLARDVGLVLEYDGLDHRVEEGREKDGRRDDRIQAIGLHGPLHLYAEDLDAPAALQRRVCEALRRAAVGAPIT